MADTLTGSVRCPFYESHGAITITCEGDVGHICRHSFNNYRERTVYMTKICCVDYNLCPHYLTVLDFKYGGDE